MPRRLTSEECVVWIGDYGKGDTPGPMPNPEVKVFYAEGTVGLADGRIGRRQSIQCTLS